MSSAGGRMSSAGGKMSSAGSVWFPCRAADVKHLSAGSLPGTPVGRIEVASVIDRKGLARAGSWFMTFRH